MATYVCLFHNLRQGGFYVKAFSASGREVAKKRGIEWIESVSGRTVWEYMGCSTELQFANSMRKRMESDSGTRAVFGMLSSPVSEKDQETIFLWYDHRPWERTVSKPTKGVRTAVERACKAILRKSMNGNPVLVFGMPR